MPGPPRPRCSCCRSPHWVRRLGGRPPRPERPKPGRSVACPRQASARRCSRQPEQRPPEVSRRVELRIASSPLCLCLQPFSFLTLSLVNPLTLYLWPSYLPFWQACRWGSSRGWWGQPPPAAPSPPWGSCPLRGRGSPHRRTCTGWTTCWEVGLVWFGFLNRFLPAALLGKPMEEGSSKGNFSLCNTKIQKINIVKKCWRHVLLLYAKSFTFWPTF